MITLSLLALALVLVALVLAIIAGVKSRWTGEIVWAVFLLAVALLLGHWPLVR